MDMVCRVSKSTARDMVRGILEDVQELPTIYGARRIAEEYMKRGVFIKPEYLLDVWMETTRDRSERSGFNLSGVQEGVRDPAPAAVAVHDQQ